MLAFDGPFLTQVLLFVCSFPGAVVAVLQTMIFLVGGVFSVDARQPLYVRVANASHITGTHSLHVNGTDFSAAVNVTYMSPSQSFVAGEGYDSPAFGAGLVLVLVCLAQFVRLSLHFATVRSLLRQRATETPEAPVKLSFLSTCGAMRSGLTLIPSLFVASFFTLFNLLAGALLSLSVALLAVSQSIPPLRRVAEFLFWISCAMFSRTSSYVVTVRPSLF